MTAPARNWRLDRLPIATYEQAVWRLVPLREDETLSDDAYDLAVSLVAEIFWLSENAVRRDVRKYAAEIG